MTAGDQIVAQDRILREVFGIEKVAAGCPAAPQARLAGARRVPTRHG